MWIDAIIEGRPIKLEKEDDYLHPLGEEKNFNESMYFNFFDPDAELGGWMRLGNRANEGYAEMTVCLYLPDGRVAFMFQRPSISDNDRFDAGGMVIDVVRPFEELRVRFEGEVLLLTDPLALADPKQAFAESPRARCVLDLTFLGTSHVIGGEPEELHEKPGEEVARGHTEQLTASTGSVAVGEQQWLVQGHGLRDHSWGPRYWQNVDYHRWITGNVGADFGFMGVLHAAPSGVSTGGFVWDDGSLYVCERFHVETTWTTEDSYHDTMFADFYSGDRKWRVEGQVLSLIPLRNRREGQVTRISEGLARWTLADGRVGYGMSEYLDQMIDGRPLGLIPAAQRTSGWDS